LGIPSPFLLDGRVALVTGASRGLGYEIAFGLARAGAHVLVNSRSPERTAEVATRINAEGLQATPLPFDIADEAAATAAVAEVESRFGRLDILVHNVGARFREPVDRISTGDFNHMLNVDLAAPFMLTKLAVRLMIAQEYGRLIFVTSIAGIFGSRGDAAYNAAKAGLGGLMRSFACEYGVHGINSNAIAPGPFATESNDGITEERLERVRKRVPLGRRGEPHEIAGPAVFLASEAASYVNGHTLVVDAGYTVSL
jgi:gluconate 5-dehydrogenase